MANVLAKLPQQRIRAGEKHPTVLKLEKLFNYMDDLGIELAFYYDRVFVIDSDRPQDKDWEIRDVVNHEFLTELPCYPHEYKITQEVDISPRDAQPAPPDPKKMIAQLKGKKKMIPKVINPKLKHQGKK